MFCDQRSFLRICAEQLLLMFALGYQYYEQGAYLPQVLSPTGRNCGKTFFRLDTTTQKSRGLNILNQGRVSCSWLHETVQLSEEYRL